jgi:hypothetical protein
MEVSIMAAFKQSDRVREIVIRNYIEPALRTGSTRLSIRARDVLKDAEANQDFPRGRTPLICNVLQSKKLLTETGLEVDSIDGPPSRQSRTVVVHYRVAGNTGVMKAASRATGEGKMVMETSAERAFRLTEKLRGLLKDELAAYGGGEAFIKWMRSEEGGEA